MDIRVGSLKPGARLVFGRHSLRDFPDYDGIVWLKLERGGGKFITESVIDLLLYDNEEPRNPDLHNGRFGTKEWELSNLHQYLNAVEDTEWWRPMHQYDEPPRKQNTYNWRLRTYVDRPGFLSEFEDYELAVLTSDIYLPDIAGINGMGGAQKYDLFKKKGVRAHPTHDVVRRYHEYGAWGCDLHSTDGFAPYWVIDPSGEPGCFTRSGYLHRGFSRNELLGIRPMCEINPDAIVDVRGDGVYVIRPFEAAPMETATDDDIMLMLGLG